jgi:UDP-N-acetyl-D-mannosaminuronate dehydrogenase
MSYKRNVGDAREAPSIVVAKHLVSLGASVRAADPYVRYGSLPEGVELADFTAEEVAAADAVVLLTDHDCFDLDLVAQQARYVLDTRHRMAGERVEHL